MFRFVLLLSAVALVNASDWVHVAHFSDPACSAAADSLTRVQNKPGCQLSPGGEYSYEVLADGSVTFYTVYSDLGEDALAMCVTNDMSNAATYSPSTCNLGFRVVSETEARTLFPSDEHVAVWNEHSRADDGKELCGDYPFATYVLKGDSCGQLPMSAPFRISQVDCHGDGVVFTNFERVAAPGDVDGPGCGGDPAAVWGAIHPYEAGTCRTDVAQNAYNYASTSRVGDYWGLTDDVTSRSGMGPLFVVSFDDDACSNPTGAVLLPPYTPGECVETVDMLFRVVGGTVEVFTAGGDGCEGPAVRVISAGLGGCDGGFRVAQSISEGSVDLSYALNLVRLDKSSKSVWSGGCDTAASLTYLLIPDMCYTPPMSSVSTDPSAWATSTWTTLHPMSRTDLVEYTTYGHHGASPTCSGDDIVFHAQRSIDRCEPMGYTTGEMWGAEAFCADFGSLWSDDDDACAHVVPGVYRSGHRLVSKSCPFAGGCEYLPAMDMFHVGMFNPESMEDHPEC